MDQKVLRDRCFSSHLESLVSFAMAIARHIHPFACSWGIGAVCSAITQCRQYCQPCTGCNAQCMSEPGAITTSELESSEVFATHLASIGGKESEATAAERATRGTSRKSMPRKRPPPSPVASTRWRYRIFCGGAAAPSPGSTGAGITVASGPFTTDIRIGCER
jgi:hypothetical protein